MSISIFKENDIKLSSRYSKYHLVSSNYKPFYSELQYYYFISELNLK